MMKPAVILAIIGYASAVAIPDVVSTRDVTWETTAGIDRTFTLASPWADETPVAKREPEVEERAPEPGSSDQFGTGPDPTQVQITGLTYGGTGCPATSVGSAISTDRTIMTLIFDNYVASIGPGVAITEARKNCQLNLQLQYPGGFQYSILSADYRGYAYLEKGVTGTQQSIYYFSGQTAQADTGTSWKGPMDEDYLLSDTAVSATLVWSPCGALGMLNINSAIKLTSTNASASGLLTTDSVDTKFTQEIYIQWQPCTAT